VSELTLLLVLGGSGVTGIFICPYFPGLFNGKDFSSLGSWNPFKVLVLIKTSF